MIGRNLSLLTSGISYSSLASEFGRAFRKGWVMKSTLRLDSVSALIICVGTAAVAAGGCLSLGNLKMKKLSNIFTAAGSAVMLSGLGGIAIAYSQISQTEKPKKIEPIFSNGFYMILIVAVLILIVTLIAMAKQPKVEAGTKYEMETKYRLFLMLMPFLALAGVFCYLPLWGWRYAFFDYKVGDTLSMDNFVGFKWFTQLFKNPATVRDIIRVLKNTLHQLGSCICNRILYLFYRRICQQFDGKCRNLERGREYADGRQPCMAADVSLGLMERYRLECNHLYCSNFRY